MKTVITGIDYDEPDQDTYRGVTLSIRDIDKPDEPREEKKFFTGYPPLDLIEAHNYLVTNIGADKILRCSWSSSVDHFTMDGDKYAWYEEDGEEWLKASDSYKETDEFKKLKAEFEAREAAKNG